MDLGDRDMLVSLDEWVTHALPKPTVLWAVHGNGLVPLASCTQVCLPDKGPSGFSKTEFSAPVSTIKLIFSPPLLGLPWSQGGEQNPDLPNHCPHLVAEPWPAGF